MSKVRSKNTVVILETIEAQDKLFKSINTKGLALQKEMHQAACSVLWHVGKHGDVRRVSALLAAIVDSVRTNALRAWFENYGPVRFENNVPVFVRGKQTQLGAAMEDPFWKFKPEAPYVSVDVVAMLSSTIKKLQTDMQKTEGADHSVLISVLEAQVQNAQASALAAAKAAEAAMKAKGKKTKSVPAAVLNAAVNEKSATAQ